MKKTYTIPAIQETTVDLCQAVALSGVEGTNGIKYGGIDKQGSKDPDANRRNDSNVEWGNLW